MRTPLLFLSLFAVIIAGCDNRRDASHIEPIVTAGNVVYGDDNREEPISNTRFEGLASSVAVMVESTLLKRKKDYFIFDEKLLGDTEKLCEKERFRSQNAIGVCSGFLIAKNRLVTAGHCISKDRDCSDYSWVFNYDKANSDSRVIQKKQVYGCKKVLAREMNDKTGLDYAVIELDRMAEHAPLSMNLKNPLQTNSEIFIIGYPSGMPIKIASSAHVRSNDSKQPFVLSNLDAFSGNSGSPVFNNVTGKVEGILVRGSSDYTKNKNGCYEVNVCLGDKCKGEGVTKLNQIDFDYLSSNLLQQELDIVNAVKRGDVKKVKEYLADGASINSRDVITKDSLLMVALEKKDLSMINFLLKSSEIDLLARNIIGENIVDVLSYEIDTPEYKEILLQAVRRAPTLLTEKDKQGKTLLMLLAKDDDSELMELLFDEFSSLNMNAVNHTLQWSALMYATYYQSDDSALILLDQENIDITLINKLGCNALMLAASHSSLEVVNQFLSFKGLAINAQDDFGINAIMGSVLNIDNDVYFQIANYPNVDFNLKNLQGDTIFDLAVKHDRDDIIADLVMRGVRAGI